MTKTRRTFTARAVAGRAGGQERAPRARAHPPGTRGLPTSHRHRLASAERRCRLIAARRREHPLRRRVLGVAPRGGPDRPCRARPPRCRALLAGRGRPGGHGLPSRPCAAGELVPHARGRARSQAPLGQPRGGQARAARRSRGRRHPSAAPRGSGLPRARAGRAAGRLTLCPPKPGTITGQILHADGGASLMDPVFPLTIRQDA
jgi:hypothetical protein